MPGCPHRLSFISPLDGHLSVPNGEIMDSITLACQDEYGNRCSPTPQFGSKWYVRLDKSGPLSSSLDKFPVQTDGTVTLDGLYIELEEAVAYPGVRKIQPLLLEWPEHLGFGENIPPVIEELCVTVTPGTKPSAIEVMTESCNTCFLSFGLNSSRSCIMMMFSHSAVFLLQR